MGLELRALGFGLGAWGCRFRLKSRAWGLGRDSNAPRCS